MSGLLSVRAGWEVRGLLGVLGLLGGVRGKEVMGDRVRGLRYLLVVREDSLSIVQV